jgi:hypothetical protein
MANTTGKKFGGRTKGTPNKTTALVKTVCDYIVDSGFEKFKNELNKLSGEKYVDAFLKIAKIVTDDTTKLAANEKLIELYNQKINQNGGK